MRMVVDISENWETKILNMSDSEIMDFLYTIVRNGIPLPKCHGRLIDEKDLSLMTVHMIDGMFVCDAPTIIEADGGVE